ncbi:SFT2-like protein, partial [Microstroma glucosiphilum]
LVGGLALSLAGAFLLFLNTALFAIFYSIGVVLSLVGTGFLIGFMKQFRQMFNPVRVVATIVLLVSFVLVWVAAFAVDSAPMAIVFVVVLYLAYIWYSLSYIPYAREFVKNMFSKFF